VKLQFPGSGGLAQPPTSTLASQAVVVVSVGTIIVCTVLGSRVRAWALRRHRAGVLAPKATTSGRDDDGASHFNGHGGDVGVSSAIAGYHPTLDDKRNV